MGKADKIQYIPISIRVLFRDVLGSLSEIPSVTQPEIFAGMFSTIFRFISNVIVP